MNYIYDDHLIMREGMGMGTVVDAFEYLCAMFIDPDRISTMLAISLCDGL